MIVPIHNHIEFNLGTSNEWSMSAVTPSVKVDDGVSIAKSGSYYPVGEYAILTSKEINPNGLVAWSGIMPDVTAPTGTTIEYQLGDGTDFRYWGGASWDVASSSQWTSLTALQANFSSFPVTAKRLVVRARLSTTDRTVTPKIRGVLVAYTVRLNSYMQEYVSDTLLAMLAEEAEPEVDWSLSWPATGATMDMSAYQGENSYVITDVLEAYDYSADPTLGRDLLDSYDAGTGILTLTSPLAEGTRVYLRVMVLTEYVLTRHQDYDVFNSLPRVVARTTSRVYRGGSKVVSHWLNYATGSGEKIRTPRRIDYVVELDVEDERDNTVFQICDKIVKAVETHEVLDGYATALPVRLTVVDEGDFLPRPSGDGVMRHTLRVKICHAQEWMFDQEDAYAIQTPVVAASTS